MMNRSLGITVCVVAVIASLSLASRGQQAPAIADFEGASAGEVRRLETAIGQWSADAGHAVIDAKHHRSGQQCLHLLGGKLRQIVLAPKAPGAVRELRFWAERWTRKDPFKFRIEQFRSGKWHEIYRGDQQITIGTFRTLVRVPLKGALSKLRFTCTSVAGVLLDDVRFSRSEPMRVVSTTVTQPVVPCLVGNAHNTVAVVELDVVGDLQARAVRELHLNLSGCTELADVAAVEVLCGDGLFGKAAPPKETMVFRGVHNLTEGNNTFRVSLRLRDGANIDHVVDAGCDAVVLREVASESDQLLVPEITNPTGAQRCGVALRNAGDDGCRGYRIPGITTTNAGTLIAVYDARWRGMGDLPGDIDVGMSRSTDGGQTWEPMRVILDTGKDEKFRYDGVGDPSILCDRKTGAIWVIATWSHGNRSWNGSGPGLTPDETGQLLLVRSDDDGRTWSKPINITRQVKRPEWCFLLQGPGRGICMQNGTLVFAAQYQDTPKKRRMPYSTILYSLDQGETWQLGTGPRANTTEAQVEELAPGTLMLNMRDNRGGSRAIYTTTDLGKTWAEHPTSRKALIEPVCNAALLRAGARGLLFVNPAVSDRPRRSMTIRHSPDLGATWPQEQQLLLDQGASAGYPSATMIDDEWVGVLFEGSSALLTFVRVRLADLRE